jgi:hypothetical protein
LEHFLTTPREGMHVIESIRPRLNRVMHAAMLLGALTVVASTTLPATAHAVPNKDQIGYIDCLSHAWDGPGRLNPDGTVTEEWMLECCALNNGTWKNNDCTFDAQNQARARHDISGLPVVPVTPMPAGPRHIPGDVSVVPVNPS